MRGDCRKQPVQNPCARRGRFERRPEAEPWMQEEARCDLRRENTAEVWPGEGMLIGWHSNLSLGRCGELIGRSQEEMGRCGVPDRRLLSCPGN